MLIEFVPRCSTKPDRLRYLIDNDVFLVALYAGHEAHPRARRWLDKHKRYGWGIAAETFLAALRLLMNPAVMSRNALDPKSALHAIQTELAGTYPGKIILAGKTPEATCLAQAIGQRQIMDLWLLQIARDKGLRFATRDQGILTNWPTLSVRVK